MRLRSGFALALSAVLLSSSVLVGLLLDRQARSERVEQDRQLAAAAEQAVGDLTDYFERARAVILVMSRNAALPEAAADASSRRRDVAVTTAAWGQVNAAFHHLETLYPD